MIPECQICRFYHNNSSRQCHRKCKNNGGNIHADESARTSYFFRPFVGQEINSTPKLRAPKLRDFRYVAFTTVTLLVPFVQSGNDFEIPFIGFPCLNPFFKFTSDLTQGKSGELHPVPSLQRAVHKKKQKKTATTKKTM